MSGEHTRSRNLKGKKKWEFLEGKEKREKGTTEGLVITLQVLEQIQDC